MPDIAMCHGMPSQVECPRRGSCYRYTATPTPHRQAYALPAHDPRAEECRLYWPNNLAATYHPHRSDAP